jgi:hypothetical protein
MRTTGFPDPHPNVFLPGQNLVKVKAAGFRHLNIGPVLEVKAIFRFDSLNGLGENMDQKFQRSCLLGHKGGKIFALEAENGIRPSFEGLVHLPEVKIIHGF